MGDIEELMAGIDAPVAIPAELRGRLLSQLTSLAPPGAVMEEPLMAGLDAPHPLDAAHRDRLAAALADAVGAAGGARAVPAGRGIRPVPRWLALTAAIILVAGTTLILGRNGRPSGRHLETALPRPATTVLEPGASPGGAGAIAGRAQIPPTATRSGTPGGSAAAPQGMSAAGSGASAPSAAATGPGPAPPFFSATQPSDAAAGPAPAAAPAPSTGSASSQPTAVVSVIEGDGAEQAGFDAYLSTLDRSASRHISAVAGPDRRAVATVNLSDGPAPAQSAGPVLETLAVPESALRAPVFDAASAPVHQAGVAVAAVFPTSSPGRIATVYRGTQGVWAAEVPNAMSAALQRRGVATTVIAYAPGHGFQAGPGDAAFLALDTVDAKSWIADAARTGYRPALGVTGISSLVDPSLLPSLPDGTRAVGAYDLPGTEEQAALSSALGRQPGVADVHGWVTAKLLAVALWRSGATTRAETTAALGNLVGYDDGFNPPIAYRNGTTSRTPDGVVFAVHHGTFTTDHAFRTDPGG